MAEKKAAKAMTKAQLMTYLADKSELPKKKIVELFDALTELAYKEAKKDAGFVLPGFGKLVVVKTKARTGRNPQTGESIKIPAKKRLKFRIAKAAKDAVGGGK
ncbi:MAG: HU family DNA-binding protein [Candidatus Sumerlaeia bacterium]|nr:HU family DNA-binding protein [Candidatus Sumerlaeia bacterium]